MQRTIFQCDQCEKELGQKPHIHIDLRQGRAGVAMPQPNSRVWGLHKKINGSNSILHFCNGQCTGRFFTNLMKETKKK